MVATAKPVGQEAAKKSLLSRLRDVSLRTKIIGVVLIVLLVLIVISIPNDRSQLLARQERVDAAQVAYDLARPAVAPSMESVKAAIDSAGVDLSGNRLYSGIGTALTTYNRTNATLATQFQGVVTFSQNVHSLLDGANAIAGLDTVEFRALVADMDTTLSVAWLALMELNISTDEYNGYHSWLSATVAGTLFGLPQGYVDPIPSNSRLTRESLAL